jgi:hypothetical protein
MLVDAACREKLVGATRLIGSDITNAGILVGRVGEDVCADDSPWVRIGAWWRKPSTQTVRSGS